MTSRRLFEHILTEINKVETQTILLDDFNHHATKGIYQYANKIYNLYETGQQVKDDLRVLETSTPELIGFINGDHYEFYLPSDYYHILGCNCYFSLKENYKCGIQGQKYFYAANKMTSDMRGQIMSNYYMQPSYKRPYYFIHNRNTSNDIPTYPYISSSLNSGLGIGTDFSGININNEIPVENLSRDSVKPLIGKRYGNASAIRLELHYGQDSFKNQIYQLDYIIVDYLKVPQNILLTQDQIDLVEDYSQIIEFPDYVCYEIINEVTKLLLENASDPRLNTFLPVNQSIARPQATQ